MVKRKIRYIWCFFTLAILLSSSALAVFYPQKRCFLIILLYHDIVETAEEAGSNPLYSTTKEKFEEDMLFWLNEGYEPLSLRMYYDGEYKTNGRYFCVTFDDGYLSNYTMAFPILQKYSIYGDIFIVPGTVELDNHFKYNQADEMEQSGLIAIYSHSYSHNNLTEYTSDELIADTNDVYDDFESNLSKRDRVMMISYPGGQYNAQTVETLREAGYKMQFVQNLPERGSTDLLKRYMVYYNTKMQKILQDYESEWSIAKIRDYSVNNGKTAEYSYAAKILSGNDVQLH